MKKILLTLILIISLDAKTLTLQFSKESQNAMTWADALVYCEELSSQNRSDWRLPKISELVTLKDASFDVSRYYWSSTTYAYFKKTAWFSSSSRDYQHFSLKTKKYYVRCVSK
jgi:hypothetical protein